MRGQPHRVKELLDKARESCLLAVEVYNKPTATFRSGAFIVLMVIAWTALIQAVLHKKRISYYQKHSNGRYVYVDGEKKAWDVSRCLNEYFKDQNDPARKNIELIVRLRDKLEHRSYPELDETLFGECQALVMNFEEVFQKEFPKELQLKHNLVFAIQFSRISMPQQEKATVKRLTRDLASIKSYIEKYRTSLTDDQWKSPKYSFRLLLVPKVSNNRNSNDVAVEFVRFDPSKPEEMAKYEKLTVIVKDKVVELEKLVPSQELYQYKPMEIVAQVSKNIGKKFTINMHATCWKHYKVRPADKAHANQCDKKYCLFDKAHKDFVYSQAWIEFLSGELRDDLKYAKICQNKEQITIPK